MEVREVVGVVVYETHDASGYIALVVGVVVVVVGVVAQAVTALVCLVEVEAEQKLVEVVVFWATVQVAAFSPRLDPMQHSPGHLRDLVLRLLQSWVSSLLRYHMLQPVHPLSVRNVDW